MASSMWQGLRFTWDPEKAARNVAKHKISFELAQQVFYDPDVLILPDEEHSYEEERAYALGRVPITGVLIVVFTDRTVEGGVETLHLISAREAESEERNAYERANGWY